MSADEKKVEKCQRCGAQDGGDLRTLWMSCFYEMGELVLPFDQKVLFQADIKDLAKASEPVTIPGFGDQQIVLQAGTVRSEGELSPIKFYTLRVCKDCRASWMSAINEWFVNKPASDALSCGSGIFVRQFGTNVEITQEEWERRAAAK